MREGSVLWIFQVHLCFPFHFIIVFKLEKEKKLIKLSDLVDTFAL